MNFHKQNLLRSFSKSKMSQLWSFRLFVYNYVNMFIYVVPFVTFILFVKKNELKLNWIGHLQPGFDFYETGKYWSPEKKGRGI